MATPAVSAAVSAASMPAEMLLMAEISPLLGATYGQYNYTLDVLNSTPVGNLPNGDARLDNSNPRLAATLWISTSTADTTPINLQSFLANIAVGDSVVLQDKNNPAIWGRYLVTATSSVFSTTQKLNVTYQTGGLPLVEGNAVVFGVIPGLISTQEPIIITAAGVPPSAPGQPYISYKSGSATVPATPLSITGTPIVPPPTIGNPSGVPTFPPPTPPPIGTVPVGPLVGPAVANAAVPPSTAGFPLVRYQAPGSATVPTAASLFPAFTTTGAYAGFPNNPPNGVPIVFANVWNNPGHASVGITAATWATGQTTYTTASAHGIPVGTVVTITGCTPAAFNGNFTTITGTTGSTIVVAQATTPGTFASGGNASAWIVTPPASTPTTGQIILNGWGLPGPSGTGPGPPSSPNPPGAGLPHVAIAVQGGHAGAPQRPRGPVFSLADLGQLHQSEPAPHSRRKRMSARHAAGGDDLP